ncbi:MAG: type IV pilus twitching motility protein PilT [Candidatus Latescibacterota bacterium]|nr:MAG: type IV pilus twitching motility protein PilT [Candidatus Latescibacterota bacterium]
MELKALLKEMVTLRASDLHLKAGAPPIYRIDGELRRTDLPALTPEDLLALAEPVLSAGQREILNEELQVDFAVNLPTVARFRANFHTQRGSLAMTFRIVPFTIAGIEELGLPRVVEEIATKPRGLVLVTGTVGSGKSTTLAAMIDRINAGRNAKIITIEDPIEFVHEDRKGLIIQREVGEDTRSFEAALKHILRQDPNVILIGEIRDIGTMSVALTAANTGHLVLSTLHTIDSIQTINRVVSFFPPHQHKEVRFLLASCLQAIVSQRLVRRADGVGRIPAVEVLLCTGTIRDYILDPEKTALIRNAIQEGYTEYGMQSFDQSLMQLYREGKITYEEALRSSSNPSEFDLRVRGIEAASDKTWDFFEGRPGETPGAAPASLSGKRGETE